MKTKNSKKHKYLKSPKYLLRELSSKLSICTALSNILCEEILNEWDIEKKDMNTISFHLSDLLKELKQETSEIRHRLYGVDA